ncbi:MAG: hypothetical protein U5K74_13290 [Gemmatimonadaceae bacterium]|nr:hypothetical protein [Gemmatimonadaceae bacterium]
MTTILPGSTIGFLGGGQLARMSALAARAMGYDVHVLDPDAECPSAPCTWRTSSRRRTTTLTPPSTSRSGAT